MKDSVMSEEIKCLRCGSINLEPSHLQSTGKIYSCPKDAKLITFLTSGTPVDSLACLDCGHVELLVDTKKIRSLIATH
jgi:predicted nucleic-acid-binding Zn-ribbon protein